MRIKNVFALAAMVALFAALALVGCGGSQASTNESANTTDANATTSESAATTSESASTQGETAATSNSQADASNTSANANGATSSSAPTAPDTSSYIGDDAAKAAALAHAGVAEADCAILNVHLDYDDSMPHYEVNFHAGGMEYDYDIDPTTGDIISFECESEIGD